MGAHESTLRMRVGSEQQMSEFMRHCVAKDYGRGEMGFLFQLLDWLVEKIGIAASAILPRKGYSDCGDLQPMRDAENLQMKMRGKGHFGAAAKASGTSMPEE